MDKPWEFVPTCTTQNKPNWMPWNVSIGRLLHIINWVILYVDSNLNE